MPVDELNLHRATVGGGKEQLGANLVQTEGRARSPPVKLMLMRFFMKARRFEEK